MTQEYEQKPDMENGLLTSRVVWRPPIAMLAYCVVGARECSVDRQTD